MEKKKPESKRQIPNQCISAYRPFQCLYTNKEPEDSFRNKDVQNDHSKVRSARELLSKRDKQMKSDTCRTKTLTSHGPFLFLKPTTLETEKIPHDSWVQV